jgi:hypothetical protein
VGVRLLALLAALFVAACSLPTQQVDNYRSAFAEARNSGIILLDKISPAVASVEPTTAAAPAVNCGINSQGYYRCFDPTLALQNKDRADPPGIAARRLAIETVALYNDLLLDLVNGKVIDRTNAKIGELSDLVLQLSQVAGVAGSFTPIISQVTPALQAFASSLRSATSSIGLRRALVEGAPLVQEILTRLAVDTRRMFEIYSAYQAMTIARLDADIKIATLGGRASEAVQQRADVVANINTFHDSLTAYVVVLEKTNVALDALSEAAMHPVQSISDLTKVAAAASEIRSRATDFWNIVRKLR